MGNSPSRSELHGDHMSNINSGQETFQSHSYPAKFSSAPLPGIHNEYNTNLPAGNGQIEQSNHNDTHRQGRRSVDQLTPDPLYSMDSLNVCGNAAGSITSSDLPPSSISPAHCQDPWRPSSFSDESLHTQCRNLSRLHKDFHHPDYDEGLSSSTFESDSLNPDATLSRMASHKNPYISKVETTPKPEIAEEATEEFTKQTSSPEGSIKQNSRNGSAGKDIQSNIIDYSITINGRKVTASEETPLPIILAPPKDSENNGSCISSKIGIVSSDVGNNSNNSKSRGRMKSPPPPPPTSKSNGSSVSDNDQNALSQWQPSSHELSEKKRSSSLSSLLRRNVFSSSKKNSSEISDKTLCGGEVNVIPTPLSPPEQSPSGCNQHNALLQTSAENDHDSNSKKTKQNRTSDSIGDIFTDRLEILPDNANETSIKAAVNRLPTNNGKSADILVSTATAKTEFEENTDQDTLISLYEEVQKLEKGDVRHAVSSVAYEDEVYTTVDSNFPMSAATPSLKSVIHSRKETVNEQVHLDDKYRELLTNKTELGCKDTNEDANRVCTLDEIEPVSCSPNGEMLHKEERGVNDTPNNRRIAETHAYSTKSNPDTKEVCNNVANNFAFMNGSPTTTNKNELDSENSLETGIDLYETQNIFTMDTSFAEDDAESKFGTVKRRGDSSRESTPQKFALPSFNSDIDGEVKSEKSSRNSNVESRRGSSSSTDMNNMPMSSSLLNCNRLSLCSQSDQELEVESFEIPSSTATAIQDQPLSLNTNESLASSNHTGNDGDVKGRNSKNTSLSSQASSIEESRSNDAVEIYTIKSTEPGGLPNDFKESNQVGNLAPAQGSKPAKQMNRNDTYNMAKINGHGHQRRLSITKMDFEFIKKPEEPQAVASSAPICSNQVEKFMPIGRKTSYPELYVNTEAIKAARRLSIGNEKPFRSGESGIPKWTGPGNTHESGTFSPSDCTIDPLLPKNGKSDTKDIKEALSRTTPSFANDFLQTLGEIYASKSKLLTNKKQSSSSPPTSVDISSSPPKTTQPAIPVCKGKMAEPLIDPVEPLECQDRSISEYNISPRSAREVVSDSMLNCSLSSSLSQKSIVTTIHEVDEKPAPPTISVPFSAGVVDSNSVGNNGMTTAVNDVVIPQLTQTKSLTNSATYKKKPTFIRSRLSNGGSLPCVEIFDPPSAAVKIDESVPQNYLNQPVARFQNQPELSTPPSMPPLQYCQSISDSSMGDSSSDSMDKSKSPCFTNCDRDQDKNYTIRNSPDKIKTKLNGNISSECSLVELSLANQNSTSDAIIVELKQAQAKKLQTIVAENVSDEEPTVEIRSKTKLLPAEVHPPQLNKIHTGTGTRSEFNTGDDFSQQSINQCNTYRKPLPENKTILIEDPQVKAIVNGKHTNNIIVNSTPTVKVGSERRSNQLGGVKTNQKLLAQKRGNIMSPSLSGNFTEMNGIDSETMGASNIHDDELSGQLQQKENHINELQGNVEEIQTSNKLDGASFRRVLNEYEKTLSMFIQQIDQLKQRMDEAEAEKQTLIKERDQALEDLRNVESAFSDVHRKYERAKALLENMKTNEDVLIRRDQEMMQRIQNRDKKIDMIKEKAQESIEKMHLDYETRIKEMEFENAKLRAQYRKLEMKLSTLENDVEQKAKENAQLSALCDELINGQVGQV